MERLLLQQQKELAKLNNLTTLASEANKKGVKIVATLEHLSEAISAQNEAIQAEAQQVQQAIDGLNQTIAELRDQGSQQIQSLVDQLEQNTQQISQVFEPSSPGGRRK